jgi:hypothetical protein
VGLFQHLVPSLSSVSHTLIYGSQMTLLVSMHSHAAIWRSSQAILLAVGLFTTSSPPSISPVRHIYGSHAYAPAAFHSRAAQGASSTRVPSHCINCLAAARPCLPAHPPCIPSSTYTTSCIPVGLLQCVLHVVDANQFHISGYLGHTVTLVALRQTAHIT